MLRTKKKLKKKSVKKSTCDEATETPKSVIHFSQIPPPVPGEKLLAALQEWKSGTQQVDLSHNDGENELLQKSKKDLKLVFQCVDTDKKGFLNENEVKSALKLLGFVFNMEGKEYIRKQLDSNKGFIAVGGDFLGRHIMIPLCYEMLCAEESQLQGIPGAYYRLARCNTRFLHGIKKWIFNY
ncbi:uncharacterized protein [Engystomops pustulosus]|uniref:uncharacterized protein isoform X2 n=1 Tax=Engystomops pustulosus TaxID=76066 RepID=UPI003AFA5758